MRWRVRTRLDVASIVTNVTGLAHSSGPASGEKKHRRVAEMHTSYSPASWRRLCAKMAMETMKHELRRGFQGVRRLCECGKEPTAVHDAVQHRGDCADREIADQSAI